MNIKKTTSVKKPAKKATKKALPKFRRMTIEELSAVMAESHAKTEAALQHLSVESAKTEAALQRMSANHAKTDAKMAKSREETEKAIRELAAENKNLDIAINGMTAEHKKTEAAIQKLSDTVNGGIGGLRNSIGHITEMVLLPGLAAKMNAFGHIFTKASYRNEFKRADGSALTEVDLYLENGNAVMVVEAKMYFDDDAVNGLLERVRRLRVNEHIAGVSGKTIYAAAAGVDFTDDARRKIKEKGIYLVQINEDNDRIDVERLAIDDAGKW